MLPLFRDQAIQLLLWAMGPHASFLDVLKGEFAQGASASFCLRIFGAGIGVALSALLARVLGTEGFGAYVFAVTCVGILSAPAMLGLDGLLVRQVAIYHARSQWGLLRGILRRSDHAVLASSAILTLMAAPAAWLLRSYLEPGLLMPLLIGLTALPLLSLQRVRQMAMMGLRHVVAAQLPDSIFMPLLVGAATVTMVLAGVTPTASIITSTHLLALAVALPVLVLLVRRFYPAAGQTAPPIYRTKAWARDAWAFCLTTSIEVLGAGGGVILLGLLMGSDAAAVYSVAAMLAGVSAMPLAAIRIPLAPMVARVFATGNRSELQSVATVAARCALLFGAPIILINLVFGHWLLGIFGADFTAGYTALLILCVGQAINITFGAVGVLLQMSGRERLVAAGLAFSTFLNLGLSVGLIPVWGLEGAAAASACAMIFWNVALGAGVHRWLGIWPVAFGAAGRT